MAEVTEVGLSQADWHWLQFPDQPDSRGNAYAQPSELYQGRRGRARRPRLSAINPCRDARTRKWL